MTMLHNNILQIRDESNLGNVYNEMQLHFVNVEVSVEDIIRERVIQEVEHYNEKVNTYKHALVKPKNEELARNIHSAKKSKVDAEKQIEIALKAFSNNGFFIIIDEIQAETLQQLVTIKETTVVSFVKLTPLVGG